MTITCITLPTSFIWIDLNNSSYVCLFDNSANVNITHYMRFKSFYTFECVAK